MDLPNMSPYNAKNYRGKLHHDLAELSNCLGVAYPTTISTQETHCARRAAKRGSMVLSVTLNFLELFLSEACPILVLF